MNTTLLATIIGGFITLTAALLGIWVKQWLDRREKIESAAQVVSYRSTIRLVHAQTKAHLHSHLKNYTHSGSSGQQQVTGYFDSDKNDYWIVKGPHGKPELYKLGQPVRNGDLIRLEHVETRGNLHSHRGIPSPVTHQAEVTVFGVAGKGDANDN
jgi:dolichyl-phosphate-mannose--protein O-mannosyl transferase